MPTTPTMECTEDKVLDHVLDLTMTTAPTTESTEDKVLDHALDRTPRCWKCCRVLIDYITRPWGGLICKKCKTKNYSTPLRCPGCGYINQEGQPCPHCPPTH